MKIIDERPEILKYLGSLGLKPGRTVKIIEKAPFDGPVTIRIEGRTHALGRKITSVLMVQKTDGAS